MKNINEIKGKLGQLNELDQQKTRQINRKLESFTEKKVISTEGLKDLYNIQTEIHMFIEQYSDRLIKLLKQNHMVD
tara:strand:- start:18189 stop:18416 length:228 start_codon:yes stop_codon:yes gene_type:complete